MSPIRHMSSDDMWKIESEVHPPSSSRFPGIQRIQSWSAVLKNWVIIAHMSSGDMWKIEGTSVVPPSIFSSKFHGIHWSRNSSLHEGPLPAWCFHVIQSCGTHKCVHVVWPLSHRVTLVTHDYHNHVPVCLSVRSFHVVWPLSHMITIIMFQYASPWGLSMWCDPCHTVSVKKQ